MPNVSTPRASKYSQLADRFRRRIEKGELKVGDRLPSYVDMHRLHGVSRPTMDKVLDLLEADGFVVREPGRGVFVAQPRAATARGVIGVLGGVGHDSNRHPYFAHILEGIHEAADKGQVEMMLLGEASSIEWEKVDGVLTCSMQETDDFHRLPPGMPYVRLFMPSRQASSVVTDDELGAYEATKHLIAQGHRRIANLSSTITHSVARKRYDGYLRALREAGIKADKKWLREIIFTKGLVRSGYLERGEDLMREWLQGDWQDLGCTALLTANDDCAIGAIQAIREAGLGVPNDVSVIGFDGTEVSRYASPRLTTVEVPLHEVGATGTEMLLRQMQQRLDTPQQKAEHIVVPPRLVVRESTGPAPKR